MEDWEQERAPRKISLREKTSRLLDLPADGVAGVPKVELLVSLHPKITIKRSKI